MDSSLVLWLAFASAVACRMEGSSEPPGGDDASDETPAPSRPEAAAADAEQGAAEPAPKVHAFAWGNTTGDWNSAVAVAASGWVVSAGGGTLRVHASDDGRVLESARVCYPLLEGTILSHKGKRLEVAAATDAVPAVGTQGALSRRFERKLGRMTMTGWMGIAKVEVLKVTGSKVMLQILEETSNVTINGRKQDQFVKGFEVKLEPSE